MRKIIGIILVGILIGTVVMLSVIVRNQKQRITFQVLQITELQTSLKKSIEKTAISFSIHPEITNKVSSAFGSTKNVTLQYYFNLDGEAIITHPDSVYTIVKEY